MCKEMAFKFNFGVGNALDTDALKYIKFTDINECVVF